MGGYSSSAWGHPRLGKWIRKASRAVASQSGKRIGFGGIILIARLMWTQIELPALNHRYLIRYHLLSSSLRGEIKAEFFGSHGA
jgi:hypothetical protein